MKKAIALAAAFAASLCLVGCAGTMQDSAPSAKKAETESAQKQAEAEPEQPAEAQTAEVGDTVEVSSSRGEVNVTVEGFDVNAKINDEYASYGHVSENEEVGLLLLVVENVSYREEHEGMGIELDRLLHVNGEDGVSLSIMSSSTDFGKYEGAAGGYVDCEKGRSKRVAVFYAMDAGAESVTVVAGKTEIPVTVARS